MPRSRWTNQNEPKCEIFVEIRSFLARDESAAREAIPLILQQIRTTLIDNEWFELMPRYEAALRRVRAKFSL